MRNLKDLEEPETVKFKKRKPKPIIVEYRTKPAELEKIESETDFICKWLKDCKDWRKHKSYPNCKAAHQAVEKLNNGVGLRLNYFEYRIKPDQCDSEMVPRNG